MKTTYILKPVSTEDVELSKNILKLSELIAKNVHEVWADSRMSEGWTYGKERNDALKQHPCLIPYDELPEIEKDYDRNTAMQTLKLIQKLGYTIKKGSHE